MKKKLFLWTFLFIFLTTFYFDFSKTNVSEFFTIKNFEIKNTEKISRMKELENWINYLYEN